MEKMGLLSSQGCMVTGQEVTDTSWFKENSVWMQNKIIDAENSYTLE